MVAVALLALSQQLYMDLTGDLPAAWIHRLGHPSPTLERWTLPVEMHGGAAVVKLDYRGVRRRFLLDTGSVDTYIRPSLWREVSEDDFIRFDEVITSPSNQQPEALFDNIETAFGSRVDGILGVDLLGQFNIGLDFAAGRIALYPFTVMVEDAAADWFGNVFVKVGGSQKRIPWSEQPRALLPSGALDLFGESVAGRDTVTIKSVVREIHGRVIVQVGSGTQIWNALLDTGASVSTVSPTLKFDAPVVSEKQIVSVRGMNTLQAIRLPLSLGFIGFPPMEVMLETHEDKPGEGSLIGTDILNQGRWLIAPSQAQVMFSPYAKPKALLLRETTDMYFEPLKKWVRFRKKVRFPYAPGWFVLNGRANVRNGMIEVNQD
ncbi:MAG: hypothetical protein EOP09_00030 [Proteobacteria bacterium]|nr:MAG: hypothetical protein EOP09_00030 [Pseudomonadota bacterium]